MQPGFDALSIVRFHDPGLRQSVQCSAGATVSSAAWDAIEANHRYNRLLWHEEDKARRTDVGAACIAASKRLIDQHNQHNQKRNDAVEAIDEAILAQLTGLPRAADAHLSSETAGAMIDRLSILALKIQDVQRPGTQPVLYGQCHPAGAEPAAPQDSAVSRTVDVWCPCALACIRQMLASCVRFTPSTTGPSSSSPCAARERGMRSGQPACWSVLSGE